MTLTPGTVLDGRYEIVGLIGSGAMAAVYRTRHVGLGSLHAVKILDAALATDPALKERFLDEGRIQAQLGQHPNIVAVTEIVTDPVPGLVLELVTGGGLDQRIAARGGQPGGPDDIALMLPILAGVGHAHAHGVVHRDLKPENILLHISPAGGDPIPKVADFGIAKVLQESSLSAGGKNPTRAGARMGTAVYMSPEQVKGADQVDARSDIFALGAILYELVVGRAAFATGSEYESMHRIVQGTFAPPAEVVAGLDPRLAAVIQRALQPDPARRYPDCAAFATELAAVVGTGSAHPTIPPAAAGIAAPASPPSLPPTGAAAASAPLGAVGSRPRVARTVVEDVPGASPVAVGAPPPPVSTPSPVPTPDGGDGGGGTVKVAVGVAVGVVLVGLLLAVVVGLVIWLGSRDAPSSSSSRRTADDAGEGDRGEDAPGSREDASQRQQASAPAPDPEQFRYVQVSASSEYPSNRTYSYGPDNAIDGNPETWWGEGAEDDGLGEYLQVSWTGAKDVHEVRLIPGYLKYEADKHGDRWTLNNRIRKAEILFSGGRSFEQPFEDTKGWHTVVVDPPEEAEWVRVIVRDIYPGYSRKGTRVKDSGISEIEVWGVE